MQFYTWIIRNFRNENSPRGDLAKDMERDKTHFPRNTRPGKYSSWHKLIRGYLERNHACDSCLETFEDCWKEYLVHEGKADRAEIKAGG